MFENLEIDGEDSSKKAHPIFLGGGKGDPESICIIYV